MRILFRVLAAFVILVNLSGAGRSDPLVLRSSVVDLDTEDDQIDRVGPLKFQGGLKLTSRDPRFGGLSGLAVSDDGRRLSAVTDRGNWVHLIPITSPIGSLTGIAAAEIGKLINPDGAPVRKKHESDAESLTGIDGGVAVSFEHRHRLWLYRGAPNPFRARPREIAFPARSRAGPANKGMEALARLRDGRLIAIAEDFPEDGPFTQGWILQNRRWQGFRYRRHALFHPVGATTLPDGDLLVLERRFTYIGGFATRLVTLSPGSIRPAVDVKGRELVRLEPPLITENFEGIASYRSTAGETVLYLISDDNFLALQNTLLLKFSVER